MSWRILYPSKGSRGMFLYLLFLCNSFLFGVGGFYTCFWFPLFVNIMFLLLLEKKKTKTDEVAVVLHNTQGTWR